MTVSRGVVLFAYNSDTTDYFSMANYTASRINRHLDLPVTVITDEKSVVTDKHCFDKVIFTPVDASNFRKKSVWINKGRYRAYDLSPYDETILLDADYMVNSQTLLKTFDLPTDFACHKNTRFVFEKIRPERLSPAGVQSLWATVVMFRRTSRAEQIFSLMKVIQENYQHYSDLYRFLPFMFRNDYALTIALKTVNGHIENKSDYIPWTLNHVGLKVKVSRINDTQYHMRYNETLFQKTKSMYIYFKDQDFHLLHKDNFLELMQ
jgi:hypothetical protein